MITPFVDLLGPPKPSPSTLRLSTLAETLGIEADVGAVIGVAGAVGDEEAAGPGAGADTGVDIADDEVGVETGAADVGGDAAPGLGNAAVVDAAAAAGAVDVAGADAAGVGVVSSFK